MTTVADVVLQMAQLLPDPPPAPHEITLDGRRRYFGKRRKSWYRLREMRTRGGTTVVVGAFGNYSASKGGMWKVDVDWKGIGDEERAHLAAQREAAAAREREQRQRDARLAAMTAAELWRAGSAEGHSPYLERKGVTGEACRYLRDGSIVVPLLRYDLPREQALQAVQRIYPDGSKFFTRGFAKARCAVRLGPGVVPDDQPILVCEGYATGLTLRMALDRQLTVFVALDAGNLVHVCELLRELYPSHRLLICADDDHRTAAEGKGNPGRDKARGVAKQLERCDWVWPIFPPGGRHPGDTDFNDLHARVGLAAVTRQLQAVLQAMRARR